MDKKKKEIIIVCVLLVVFVLVVLNSISRIKKKKGGHFKKSPKVSSKTFQKKIDMNQVIDNFQQAINEKISTKAYDQKIEKYRSMMIQRDPFLGQENLRDLYDGVKEEVVVEEKPVVLEPLPVFQIEGLLYDPDNYTNSVAIISGEEKKVGDMIETWKIVRMTDTTITLSKDGRKEIVELYE